MNLIENLHFTWLTYALFFAALYKPPCRFHGSEASLIRKPQNKESRPERSWKSLGISVKRIERKVKITIFIIDVSP